MGLKTVNVGTVKAIFEGTTPPSNIGVLWRDTSLTIPLIKQYNPTTSSWEALVYFTLVDNITIKKDINGKLYVDVTEIPTLVIEDSSITFAKIQNMSSGYVLYRKTSGDGSIEEQSLATLKADLGLTGTNSGDQDLSGLVPNTRTINGHVLSGDIDLDAEDVGAPTGSGTSTGENTGDETEASILSKLGITVISGENTGDQTAATTPIEDAGELFIAEDVEGALAEVKTIADANAVQLLLTPVRERIILGASSDVATRIASGDTIKPTGWVLAADSGTNLLITHTFTGKKIIDINVFEIDGDNEDIVKPFEVAYSGFRGNAVTNTIIIYGLDTEAVKLRIELLFH